MGSTNRGRLTRAVTDGRATRVVMRLGVAIELVTGLTLLVIPGVVIRALIGADEGTASTIVGRVLGGALIGLGIAGASARGRTPERPIVLAYVVYNVSTATVLAAASVAGTASGILLWPVVAVHALLALVLLGGLLLKRRHVRPAGDTPLESQIDSSAISSDNPKSARSQPTCRTRGVGAGETQPVRRRQAASYCRHRPHPVGIRQMPHTVIAHRGVAGGM
jgi:hypothetical protein